MSHKENIQLLSNDLKNGCTAERQMEDQTETALIDF